MTILGIETSCDETAAAVVEDRDGNIVVLSDVVSSQIEIHRKYGGVVPEVAAREHVLNILPVVNEAIEQAGIKREEVRERFSAIAVTAGPGLITSLTTGVETAKTLAFAWKLPLVAVNHIEGHIFANLIGGNSIEFPAIVLTVSGGHTMLILANGLGEYRTLGDTRDDAAGEAFDKAAQLMGLGYPGGPAVSRKAAKAQGEQTIKLPRPMLNDKSYDFSFSGLKTALLYELKKDNNWENRLPEYCRAFEDAVADVLTTKAIRAAREHSAKFILLSGGVSANSRLRQELAERSAKELPDAAVKIPDLRYTTDNAAMIAAAGHFHAQRKEFTPWQKIKADCNLKF